MKLLWLVGCVVGSLGVLSAPAWASFPGRDGLIAVQPLTGAGLILVNAHGGDSRRVCTNQAVCGSPRAPSWSSDGRVIAVGSTNNEVKLIYPDGSCLNCRMEGALRPAFTPNPSLVTVLSTGHTLLEDGIDGIRKAQIVAGPSLQSAAWSARGALAVVRSGQVLVGRPDRLRSVGSGSSPSWSPDGAQIVIARHSWLLVVRVRDGGARRLVRGGAPSWSPDGRSVAYIGAHHQLRLTAVSGGPSRRLGRVNGVAIAWQPVPPVPTFGCAIPPGSTVLASSPQSLVIADHSVTGSSAYTGCLTAGGRERLLESIGPGAPGSSFEIGVSTAAVSANYAALVNYDNYGKEGTSSNVVQVYDLRTGAEVPGRGGEATNCYCYSSIDDVVVGNDGVSAAHVSTVTCANPLPMTCSTEQIVASDSSGVRTLDSINGSDYNPSSLRRLTLTGDTLTWLHAGTLESAQLH